MLKLIWRWLTNSLCAHRNWHFDGSTTRCVRSCYVEHAQHCDRNGQEWYSRSHYDYIKIKDRI